MTDAREVIAEERENNVGVKRKIDDNASPSPSCSENADMDEKKIDLKI